LTSIKINDKLIRDRAKTPFISFLLLFMQALKKKSGFTFVELAVVIVILVMLWAIAILSVRNCTGVARNSARITDTNNIKNSLELYAISNVKYPVPDDSKSVTMEWWVAFRQWVFWKELKKQLSSIDKIPVDPLDKKLYVYSRAEKLDEFQIWYSLEENEYAYINFWWEQIFASDSDAKRVEKTTWNFNWIFIKAWRKIFASPSIVVQWLNNSLNIEQYSDSDGDNVANISENKKIKLVNNGVFKEFVPLKLADSFPKTQDEQIDFARNIQKSYKTLNPKIKTTNKKLEKILEAETEEELYNNSTAITWTINIEYNKKCNCGYNDWIEQHSAYCQWIWEDKKED